MQLVIAGELRRWYEQKKDEGHLLESIQIIICISIFTFSSDFIITKNNLTNYKSSLILAILNLLYRINNCQLISFKYQTLYETAPDLNVLKSHLENIFLCGRI